MFGLSPSEIAIVGVIILLLFGAKRLPEIGRGLGGALREFRNIKKELSGNGKSEDARGKKGEDISHGGAPKSIEARLGETAFRKIPGVKKVREFID